MPFVDKKTLCDEVNRRRTFAIISHPDAGKTTMTEKLLLLGGAIRLAGSVKAKKSKKFATSDWMELEKQRGISVSTSVMNFEYRNYICNLLDTPGHQDFSEDTYRTLAAADAAIMLIDAAKGVEPQTIKLFEVCKLRGIPIFTFVNKLDREARDPLELMHEIESVLGIPTYPMSWPVSSGERFRGIIERETKSLHYFEGRNTTTETAARVIPLSDKEQISSLVPEDLLQEALESLEMLEMAGDDFSHEKFLKGELSPVFFGAAMTNFGVRLFLEKFLEMSPSPSAKGSSQGKIDPLSSEFSGFIFKIQANMDPKHRDRIAFLRIVSGVYEAGVNVTIPRLNREIRLTHPQQFFAQDRSTLDRAFAGDVVGIYDPGFFSIGDSLVEGGNFEFEGIPSFAPENFAVVRTTSALKRKQLLKGLVQLCQEGTVQMFVDESRAASDPVLAAVGSLQFDVLLFRLKNEYNVDCALDNLVFKHARWTNASSEEIAEAKSKTDVVTVRDMQGNYLFLFKNDFALSYFQENCPKISLFKSNSTLHGNMMKMSTDLFEE
ncbi:peptide chain release factor 3 [Fluviispira sanaruensis]|uniref:Peptide chain release factor 3 n=1 Tax=Fluviispira sanaruensis TaxID=2493639 RepID=A0A4P2VMI7_FLUSA|nr:peptide chain release factor 3 [Fluviispira sanaruensis]BBH54181.1 peptide chain release factor 3 [Fluviispira sanaruensis]